MEIGGLVSLFVCQGVGLGLNIAFFGDIIVDEKGLVTVALEAVEAGYGQLQRVEACGGAGVGCNAEVGG